MRRALGEKCPVPFPLARLLVEKKKRTPFKGIVIQSPIPSPSSSSSSSPPRRVPGANGSGSSVPIPAYLEPSVEEEPVVDQFDPTCSELEHLSLLVADKPVAKEPDPSSFELAPFELVVIEEPDMERSGPLDREPGPLAIVVLDEPTAERPIPPRDLTADFGERLQQCLYETIELSCSSIQGGHSEGVQREAKREAEPELTPSPDVDRSSDVRPAEREADPSSREEPVNSHSVEGDSTNKVVPISACPPSCAEMEKMLRQIPRALDADLPPSKMFENEKMVLFHSSDLSSR